MEIAKIIPIPKPGKDTTLDTSYRLIDSTALTHSKNTIKIIPPHIRSNIMIPPHQHGFRHKHSTTTALNEINNTITKGFNIQKKTNRTVAIALDLSKAFNTVNLQIHSYTNYTTRTCPTHYSNT